MKKILVMVLALALSSCAGLQTQTQKIATACAAATTGLQLVAVGVREGKINATQQAQVVAAGDKIAPVCSAATPPTLDALKQAAFDEAVALIAHYAGVAK